MSGAWLAVAEYPSLGPPRVEPPRVVLFSSTFVVGVAVVELYRANKCRVRFAWAIARRELRRG